MPRTLLAGIFLGIASLSLVAAEPKPALPAAQHKQGELIHQDGMPVVILRGTPEEMGEQFGMLAVKNAPGLDAMFTNFLTDIGLKGKQGFVTLLARKLLPAFPEDHRKEIEAAAKASGRNLDLALFANTAYDLSTGMGCATLIVEKPRSLTGAPIFGRNFDYFPTKGLSEHTLIAVFQPKGKHAFATITFTPIVGCISGMNDAGLSITLNEIHLSQAKKKEAFDWTGTPVMMAFRRVLEECTTVEEAENLLRSMKRTTTALMTICDTNGGAVFETTPGRVEVRKSIGEVCCGTNHLLCDELCKGEKCWRYDLLSAVQKHDMPLGVNDVFAQLQKVNQGRSTLQTMVFEPATRKLHLKLGNGKTPACDFPTKTFDLGKLFERTSNLAN